jgi:hypothetical protein
LKNSSKGDPGGKSLWYSRRQTESGILGVWPGLILVGRGRRNGHHAGKLRLGEIGEAFRNRDLLSHGGTDPEDDQACGDSAAAQGVECDMRDCESGMGCSLLILSQNSDRMAAAAGGFS